MKRRASRIMAAVLTLVLCMTLLPVSALAAASGNWTDDGICATSFSVQDTTAKTITITSEAELAYLAQTTSAGTAPYSGYSGWKITLSKDLDLSAHYWTPIGISNTYSFKGSFDGQGYTITGLNINTAICAYEGLFGAFNGAMVKNLNVAGNINITTNQMLYCGGIAAYLYNTSSVLNCSSAVDITMTTTGFANYGGGIAGYINASTDTVKNSYATGSVTSSDGTTVYDGGLIGYTNGIINNCYTTGTVSGTGTTAVNQGAAIGSCGSSARTANLYYDPNACAGNTSGYGVNGGTITSLTGLTAEQFSNSSVITNTYNTGSCTFSGYLLANALSTAANGLTNAKPWCVVSGTNGGLPVFGDYFVAFYSPNPATFYQYGGAKNGGTISAPADPTKIVGSGLVGWYSDTERTSQWNFATGTVTQATSLYAGWYAAGMDASLRGLKVSGVTLSPAFAADTYTYSVNTGSLASITLTPTANADTATITVNGTPVTSGSASSSLDLKTTVSPIVVKVTAEDGTTKNYSITIQRDLIWQYSVNSDSAGVTLTGTTIPITGSVAIPSSVDGYPVTALGSEFFKGKTGITSVTIPNTVKSIGVSAFSGCTGLTSVNIPNSVTYMGNRVFQGCSGLTSVNLPNSITSLGEYSFYGCTRLISVTIPDSVRNLGYSLFNGCSSLTSVSIPNSVTSISDYEFYKCSKLASITIPSMVMSIGDCAFYGCTSLTSITIPDAVTCIGGYAFYGCTGLTSITIPDAVNNIGDYVFQSCTGLTSATIRGAVTSISNYMFYGCTGLASLTIPDSVTSIGSYAFYNCYDLPSLSISDSVTTIGAYAFQGCKGLTSVTLGNGLKSIGGFSFCLCSGLTSVTIPTSVTSIGIYAFQACTSLASVTIPDSVTSIGSYAFQGCTNLTTVTFGSGITYLTDNIFQNDAKLTSVYFRGAAPYISTSAFSGVNRSYLTLYYYVGQSGWPTSGTAYTSNGVTYTISDQTREITGFSAISKSAGKAGAATYANASDVIAALPTTVTANTTDGTVSVPVSSWTDTNSYNADTAGSYTFTATLGTLPTGYTNNGSITATATVTLSATDVAISSFAALDNVAGGSVGSATYANAAAVQAALPTTVTANTADGTAVIVPVSTWADTDSYNADKCGSYTFTGTATMPTGYTNAGGYTASVEVVVTDEITGFAAIADMPGGSTASQTYTSAAAVKAVLPKTVTAATANGTIVSVPVTSWSDTDKYDSYVSYAGSYTFTAVPGTLPAGYKNTGKYTATVEVVINDDITGFAAIKNVKAGSTDSPTYLDAAAVKAVLPANVTAQASSGETVSVPVVSWTDTDTYNAGTAGSYTFTAVLGTLPIGYSNSNGYNATVEAVITAPDVDITGFATIGPKMAGKAGSALSLAEVKASLPMNVTANTASGTVSVPVASWTDTDAYNVGTVGSYTFTAVLGTLPTGYTNTGSCTATVEVAVSEEDVAITGFAGIKDEPAGKAGCALYADAAAVIAELPAKVTANTESGTVNVPVASWTDTDTYNASKGGSYTFTAVLGTLPAGFTNADGYTATVEVTLDVADDQITGFAAIKDEPAGRAGTANYATAAAVIAALPKTVSANTASGTVLIPVSSWVNTDSYNPNAQGSYTFTAVLGTLPEGYANAGNYKATVEVVVLAADIQITGFEAITTRSAGKAGSALYADAPAVQAALPTSVKANTASGTVNVPVASWTDTDTYNASTVGEYTFTAVLGTIPDGYANAGGFGISVEVKVSAEDIVITGFEDISKIKAGKVGTALSLTAVQAVLPTSVTATTADGTVSVPVTSWTDTSTYNASTEGSYTFTAVLGTLPTGFTNAGGYTAAVEVEVNAADVEITGFEEIASKTVGKVGSAPSLTEVIAALPASVTATTASGGTVLVPVNSWTDTDAYDTNTAGSYTFTAVLGTIPDGYANTDNRTATMEVNVKEADVEITGFEAIGPKTVGKAGTAPSLTEVIAALPDSVTATTASGVTVLVPVNSWTDTDAYDANTAGSYTFTAVLSTIPDGYANTDNRTATMEVVVREADVQITGFEEIAQKTAGKAGTALYADANAVIAALPATVKANTAKGTILVPVTWTDTDTYDAGTASDYTFTAELGTIPEGYMYIGSDTIAVEVVVLAADAVDVEITGFVALDAVKAGKAGSASYADADAVLAALPATVDGTTAFGTVAVPITWADTDSYDANTEGSYTFTATLGTIPTGFTYSGSDTVAVEVLVTASDVEITGFAALADVPVGNVSTAPSLADVQAALPTSVTANTASGGTVLVPVVSWTDIDAYKANVAGSYTFTAVLGPIPTGFTNSSGYTATVEAVVKTVAADATLSAVLGQTISDDAAHTGATADDAKTAAITVASSVTSVSASSILAADGGAEVTFYGMDSTFATEATEAVTLSAGSATIVYMKVVAEDVMTTLYYAVSVTVSGGTPELECTDSKYVIMKDVLIPATGTQSFNIIKYNAATWSETSVSSFLSSFSVTNNGTWKVYKWDNTAKTHVLITSPETDTADNAGTDLKIEMYDTNSKLVSTYYFVIKGDVNGSGSIDSVDLVAITNNLLQKPGYAFSEIDMILWYAADINKTPGTPRGSNMVDSVDLVAMTNNLLQKPGYTIAQND